MLKRPDGIIFDCDSTLASCEGIDELGAMKNLKEEISALTNLAMEGKIKLEEVYAKRLELIQPKKEDLAKIAEIYLSRIVLGAEELIKTLQNQGVKLAIISGGLKPAIMPLAKKLGIDEVYAVDINFDSEGNYLSLSPSPLTTATGKREVAQKFKEKYKLKNLHMVGDGMSDLEAKAENAADIFIGFGGVIVREKVKAKADIFIENPDLRELLKIWNYE